MLSLQGVWKHANLTRSRKQEIFNACIVPCSVYRVCGNMQISLGRESRRFSTHALFHAQFTGCVETCKSHSVAKAGDFQRMHCSMLSLQGVWKHANLTRSRKQEIF